MNGLAALRADFWRLRCGRSGAPAGRAGAAVAFPEADALCAYLGMDGPTSVAMGRRIVAMREYLDACGGHRDPGVALRAFERNAARTEAPAQALAGFEEASGALVLALNFDSPSLALLARLRARTSRALFVEADVLTPAIRRSFEASSGAADVLFANAAELVRVNKSRVDGERHTYVTFPFHRGVAARHSREVDFFDLPHRLDVLEALLHFRGASPVLAVDSVDGSMRIASFARTSEGPPTEAEALELLGFLARCTEHAVRAMPEAFASVAAMYARSVVALEVRETMDRRLLETYLRAWRDDPRAPLHAEAFGTAMAALAP